jgi:triphosphatase
MEIELKFLLQDDDVPLFKTLICNPLFAAKAQPTLSLNNAYYDTPNNDLRRFDFGLRTRSSRLENGTGWSEQTIKLAGQDIGGLHQRPEYTEKLNDEPESNCFADLTQFSSEIWPNEFDASALQLKLVKQFETRFSRDVWHVSMPSGTIIECVLDQGDVNIEENSTAICEIELEFVSGNVDDLFVLAQFFIANLPLRLGTLSKAARGYHLVNKTELKSKNLEAVKLDANTNVESAMTTMLNGALKYVQHHETIFIEQTSLKALRRIIDGLSQVIHILQLFSRSIPDPSLEQLAKGFKMCRKNLSWVDIFYQFKQLTNRHSPYRKKIEDSELLNELLTKQLDHEAQMKEARAFFTSSEYNNLILQLIRWLVHKEWRASLSLSQLSDINLPVRTLSADWLNSAWDKLKPQLLELKDVNQSSYIEKLYWPLASELLTGLCIGNLYEQEEWLSFRNPLVDLLIGCEELMLLNTLEKLVDEHAETMPKLSAHKSWINSKQQSLLIALSASINNCYKLKPYW